MVIKIRGHHFLCIEGFEGKGYSETFIENMRNILKVLEKNPLVVTLFRPDDICKYCPHLKENVCINEKGGEKEILEMDKNFYRRTGINFNVVYRYSYIRKIVYDVFKTKNDLEGICDKCSWNYMCKWYISRSD